MHRGIEHTYRSHYHLVPCQPHYFSGAKIARHGTAPVHFFFLTCRAVLSHAGTEKPDSVNVVLDTCGLPHKWWCTKGRGGDGGDDF